MYLFNSYFRSSYSQDAMTDVWYDKHKNIGIDLKKSRRIRHVTAEVFQLRSERLFSLHGKIDKEKRK